MSPAGGERSNAADWRGAGGTDEVVEVVVDHRFDLGSVSEFPESFSKSACAFP